MTESADLRTKREKLLAMSRQTASPEEAAVARHKLAEMDRLVEPGSIEDRMRRLTDIAHGYTPGTRVRAVQSEVLDDLYSDPIWDWNGRD